MFYIFMKEGETRTNWGQLFPISMDCYFFFLLPMSNRLYFLLSVRSWRDIASQTYHCISAPFGKPGCSSWPLLKGKQKIETTAILHFVSPKQPKVPGLQSFCGNVVLQFTIRQSCFENETELRRQHGGLSSNSASACNNYETVGKKSDLSGQQLVIPVCQMKTLNTSASPLCYLNFSQSSI